ncbi:MAG: hypothetical protein SV765_07985 [Pseudomonadota bacterium]|nr:hypothetical protein [Pseudomonadales bacterium]MDY6920138.1 hypothetical protein [Pseudomonadota bacterium]
MVIGSVLNNGVAGIQKGLGQMNQASARVAQVGTANDPAADLTESVVSLLQGKLQVQASAKVLATASDTIGSIIDIKV